MNPDGTFLILYFNISEGEAARIKENYERLSIEEKKAIYKQIDE